MVRPKTYKAPDPLTVIKKSDTSVIQNFEVPDGDNAKYVMFGLAIRNMHPIDLNDPVAVEQRVNDYFKACAENDMKPAVSGLGLALHMDRRRLWEIKTDVPNAVRMPDECRQIIKGAYQFMELLWENYMQNGKINPVSGIFLGKNNFGYQDKQEYVLTPNQSTTIDVKAIESKYDDLPD